MSAMLLGYADESGEPGVMKNEHDYFVFCIVLFKNRQSAQKCEAEINSFRNKNHLSEDYEFHYVKNSKRIKVAFVGFIKKTQFSFISISIKKNHLRNTASYRRIAELTLELLSQKGIDANIMMDNNPSLYKELRLQKKKYRVQLHFSEKESRGNNLIQLADYVTALRARVLKQPNKKTVIDQYRVISGKVIGAIEL